MDGRYLVIQPWSTLSTVKLTTIQLKCIIITITAGTPTRRIKTALSPNIVIAS